MTPPESLREDPHAGGAAGGNGAAGSASADGLEIELKLAGTAEALEALWDSAVGVGARTTSRHLVSTYFDTSDLRLRRRGFTLRVRHDGKDYVQTVKAERTDLRCVMRRHEWSTPLEGPLPDLTRLDDPAVLEAIGLVIAGELQPIFTTDVARQTKRYRIDHDGSGKAHVEAALDRGEIRCDGKTEPLCELELELLDGSSVALQREAVGFLERAALEYQPRSKAERGYALAFGEHPQFHKASPPDLSLGASAEEGLERILINCVNHWLANHAAVLDGDDAEGVHQMRVALRRLGSALTIFKSLLPAEDRKWLKGEAKFLIGGLGGARDWDVFVEELLQPVRDARPADEGLKVLQDAVDEQRQLAYDRARATIRSTRYLKFVLELGAWLESRGWRHDKGQAGLNRDLVELAGEVLHKRHKKAIKLGRKFDELSDESLHRLRISLKKLRYVAEFFVALYGKGETKAYLNSLRQLQDDLGHLNDVAVAETRLADLCGRFENANARALQLPSGTVIGWHAHALAQARPRIAKDWRAFTRARPFWERQGGSA